MQSNVLNTKKMIDPIIVIDNATQKQAVKIFEETVYDCSDYGLNCIVRLNQGEEASQFVITFPKGVKDFTTFQDIVYYSSSNANIEGEESNPILVRGFLDGSMFDGDVKLKGCVNLVYRDYNPIAVDEQNNCYVEDDDAEDALYNKTPDDDDACYFCVKLDEDGEEQYVAYPQHINNHGLVGVDDLEIKAELTKKEKMSRRLKSGGSCLKSLLGFAIICAVFYFSITLCFELEEALWMFWGTVAFYLIASFVMAIIKPVPSQKEKAFARFEDSYEHYSTYTLFIVVIIACLLLLFNKYGGDGIQQFNGKILPQTAEQKENGDIDVELPDGYKINFEKEENVNRLKGNSTCVIECRKGALGFHEYIGYKDIKK